MTILSQPQLAPSSLYRSSTYLASLLLIIAIACAYMLPGIFGHGPWKQDEAYSFGIIQHMLETGEYVVPINAGQPFMEKPPLYYWTATVFALVLKPWFVYHTGARVATVFYMAISFFFAALVAKVAWGENKFLNMRVLGTLALFAGSAGLVKHSHDMFTDVALVCGSTIALYGLLKLTLDIQNKTSAISAAIWFGLGVGIAQMSKGFLVPVIYTGTAFWAGLLIKECRSWLYVRAILLAVLVSLPFFIIWPALLAQHSIQLLMEWFWDNNVGRFLGFSVEKLGSPSHSALPLQAMSGFALPGAPLAMVALFYKNWRKNNPPQVILPLIFVAISLTILMLSATSRQLYCLPMLLPLCILGAPAIEHLPDWVASAWDWVSRFFFGALTLLAWLVYGLSSSPVEFHHWLTPLGDYLPINFITPFQPLAVAVAVLLSCTWLFTLPRLPLYGKWRGAFSWFAGITLSWGVLFTLWLPWIDHAKSYEYTYRELSAKLVPAWHANDCMASINLGESEAPMLLYYADILHHPIGPAQATDCRWLIIQTPPPQSLAPGHWQLFWQGAREGDFEQRFQVFKRTEPLSK